MAQANLPPAASGVSSQEEKVRELQRGLYTAAKRSGKRRFHALYDRLYQPVVLKEAWRRVKANRGAAGIDGVTLEAIECAGVETFLGELRERLQSGGYRPPPVRRKYIPKPGGRQRPLGIPTVRNRVVQAAAKMVLEPIFEADFKECSFGFRPKRSATQALERLRLLALKGYEWALEIDIERYFNTINHHRLTKLVERRVSDRRTLKLIRKWLKAGVLEDGEVRQTLVVKTSLLPNPRRKLSTNCQRWVRHHLVLGGLAQFNLLHAGDGLGEGFEILQEGIGFSRWTVDQDRGFNDRHSRSPYLQMETKKAR